MSNKNSKIFDNQSNDFIHSLKSRSRIQDIDESGMLVLNYDKDEYPFADAMVNSHCMPGDYYNANPARIK